MNQQEKIHLEKINQIILESHRTINERFVSEAIRQWDTIGSGCFALFMEITVNQMWKDMTKRN